MRRMVAALLSGAVAVATAGCTATFDGEVTVAGPGPSFALGRGPDVVRELPDRRDATDPEELVLNFMRATAGDPADREGVLRHARTFLAPDKQAAWNPSDEINVVRVLDVRQLLGEAPRVVVEVQQLGVLTANGRLDEPVARAVSYEFQVGGRPDDRHLVEVPSDLLLSDDGLSTYFEQRSLYFWNAEGTSLLPDLRYLARALPEAKETRLVDWLLEGPAPWLRPATQPPPQSKRDGTVVRDEHNRLVVDLSQPTGGAPPDFEKLAQQLTWTLQPGDAGLILKIDGAEQRTGGDHRHVNLASLQEQGAPMRYGIAEGSLYRLKRAGGSVFDEALGPVKLPSKLNSKLVAAAVSVRVDRDGELGRRVDERAFAVVRQEPRGQRLWIGPPDAMAPTALLRQRISQPVWLDHDDEAVLVLADGRLYQVSARNPSVERIVVPGVGGRLTAFAVAPDGRRVALVVGGNLYVAVLKRGGDVPVIGGLPRPVPTPLTDLQAVAFSREDSLVVAGSDGEKVRLAEITIDGAVQWPLRSEATADTITHLVAYTDNPIDGAQQGQIMMEAGGQSYDVYSNPVSLGESVILPSPSPGVSTPPQTRSLKVTAPSFQG